MAPQEKKFTYLLAGRDPVRRGSRRQQREVTGNPRFCWHDSGRLHKEQGAASSRAAEKMFARLIATRVRRGTDL